MEPRERQAVAVALVESDRATVEVALRYAPSKTPVSPAIKAK
jgi:hypothetical protein